MLKIYNTKTKTKDSLPKIQKGMPLRFFVCGPTVYDNSHIGHARTYSFFDSFIKYLRLKHKIKVQYLQNITDIDDKIIDRANQKNINTKELAQKYIELYQKDMEVLGIDSVDKYANASNYINEIIEQIKLLIKKGYAYEKNESVYFRINKFKNYGKLSGQKTEELQDSEREANTHASEKENKLDFVIWKKSKENEPSWDSPFGKGRPGWHIEDTAITYSIFNSPTYEMHGGAQDLIFPHHEAEIALMESAYDVSPFVNIWMHTGFLNVNGEKMSKSLENFITIEDILTKKSPQALRLFFATKHYRSPIDYTEQALNEANANQKKIQDIKARTEKTTINENSNQDISNKIQLLWDYLLDDFNTAASFSILFEIITTINKTIDTEGINEKTKQSILNLLNELDEIFFIFKKDQDQTPKEVYELAQKRQVHRENNEWEESDKIREKIKDMGYIVEDLQDGFNVSKK